MPVEGILGVTYHEVEWTPDRIQRFWDFYSRSTATHSSYFSKQLGAAIVRVTRAQVGLAGTIVDMGCGPGYLLDELLRHRLTCRAVDSSAEAVDQVNKRFTGQPGFLGAIQGGLDCMPLDDNEAEIMFLIEVLEHLSPDYMAKVLEEARRVIRPGGYLVATVPNEEHLDALKIACPECGCVFHRVQHLQSFSAPSLLTLLEANHFAPILVQSLNFNDFSGGMLRRMIGLTKRMGERLRRRAHPHLIAIGKRV